MIAVTLVRVPYSRGPFMLESAPKWLRFVLSSDRKWDALDHPEDTPNPGEVVVAAVRISSGSVHVYGENVSKWLPVASYAIAVEQPGHDILTNSDAWSAWVESRDAVLFIDDVDLQVGGTGSGSDK